MASLHQLLLCFFILWPCREANQTDDEQDTDSVISGLSPLFAGLTGLPTGNAVTGKSYLYFGDQLQLNCTLPQDLISQGYTAQNISFQKTTPLRPQKKYECIEAQYIKAINSSTALMSINNITEEEAATYSCIAGVCENSQNYPGKFVGDSDDIKVQYKPQNVTDIHCFLNNWNEYIKCTWRHPVQYIESLKDTFVTFVYNSDPYIMRVVDCPDLTMTSCTIDKISPVIYTAQINVTNNRTKDYASHIFWFDPYKSVKPAPVDDLKATDLQSKGCFSISWHHSDRYSPKWFQILLQDPNSAEWKVYRDNMTETFLKVCDQKPHTVLKISVKCRPAGDWSGFYSDSTNITYMTPPIAPSLGPESTNGSYLTGNCNHGNERNVTVYWKDVIETSKNGLITGFEIRYSYRNNISIIDSSVHEATLPLPCDSKEMVVLYAVNDAGRSVQPTLLLIAPYSFKVPESVQTSLNVEIKNTAVQVQWDSSRHQSLSYTLFWCYSSKTTEQCTGSLSSQPVPSNQSTMTVPDVTSPLNYNFGLAVTDEDLELTSAIVWSECYYDPEEPIPKLKIVQAIPDEQSVTVMWESLKCSKSTKVKVTSYIVKYCNIESCNGSSVTVIDVPPIKILYTISGLSADKKYKFAVSAKSESRIGPDSEWVDAQPKVPTSFLNYIVISIVIVIALVCGVACCYFHNACRKSRNNIKSMLQDLEYTQDVSKCESQSSSETEPSNETLCNDIESNESKDKGSPGAPGKTNQSFCVEELSDSSGSTNNSRSRLIKDSKTVQKKGLGRKHRDKTDQIPLDQFSVVGCSNHCADSSREILPLVGFTPVDKQAEVIPEYVKFKEGGQPENSADSLTNDKVDPIEIIVQNMKECGAEGVSSSGSDESQIPSSCSEYMNLSLDHSLVPRSSERPDSACVQMVLSDTPVVLGQISRNLLRSERSPTLPRDLYCSHIMKMAGSETPQGRNHEYIPDIVLNNVQENQPHEDASGIFQPVKDSIYLCQIGSGNNLNDQAHTGFTTSLNSQPQVSIENQPFTELPNDSQSQSNNSLDYQLHSFLNKISQNQLCTNSISPIYAESNDSTNNHQNSHISHYSHYQSHTDKNNQPFRDSSNNSHSSSNHTMDNELHSFLNKISHNQLRANSIDQIFTESYDKTKNQPNASTNNGSDYQPNTDNKNQSLRAIPFAWHNKSNNSPDYQPTISDYQPHPESLTVSDYQPHLESHTNPDYQPYPESHTISDYQPHPESHTVSDYQPDTGSHTNTDYQPHLESHTNPDYQPPPESHTVSDYQPHTESHTNPDYQPYPESHTISDYQPHPESHTVSDYQPHTGSHTNTDYQRHLESHTNPDYQSHTESHTNPDYQPPPESHTISDYQPHPKSHTVSDYQPHTESHTISDYQPHPGSHTVSDYQPHTGSLTISDYQPHLESHTVSDYQPHTESHTNTVYQPHPELHTNTDYQPHLESHTNPDYQPYTDSHTNPDYEPYPESRTVSDYQPHREPHTVSDYQPHTESHTNTDYQPHTESHTNTDYQTHLESHTISDYQPHPESHTISDYQPHMESHTVSDYQPYTESHTISDYQHDTFVNNSLNNDSHTDNNYDNLPHTNYIQQSYTDSMNQSFTAVISELQNLPLTGSIETSNNHNPFNVNSTSDYLPLDLLAIRLDEQYDPGNNNNTLDSQPTQDSVEVIAPSAPIFNYVSNINV